MSALHLQPYRLVLILTLVMASFSPSWSTEWSDAELSKFQTLLSKDKVSPELVELHRAKAKANPKSSDARLELGKTLLSMDRFEEAREILTTLNGDVEPRAHLLLELTYEALGQLGEQIRILDLLVRRFSHSAHLLNRLANAHLKNKNPKKAAEILRGCIKNFPDQTECYFSLLSVYETSKNNYETRILLTDMTNRFGKSGPVYTRLCKVYATNSFIGEGLKVCETAIRLAPKVAENHVYFALLKKFNKETVESESLLKNAARDFPKSETAQLSLGQLQCEQKNFEACRRTFAVCVKHNTKSDRCWTGLSKVAFELKDFQTALKAFGTACRLDVKVRSEFRAAITQLRIANQAEWASKFSTEFDRCGLNAPLESDPEQ